MHSYPALSYVLPCVMRFFPPSRTEQKQHRGWGGDGGGIDVPRKDTPAGSTVFCKCHQRPAGLPQCPETSYKGDSYTSWKNSVRVRIMSPEPQAVCHPGLGGYLGTPGHFQVCRGFHKPFHMAEAIDQERALAIADEAY